MSASYSEFLKQKSDAGGDEGFAPIFMPDFLFDFQQHLIDFAVRKGRTAIFSDCGTGKTIMELVWAENIIRHTGGRVLMLHPLAVAYQTEREAQKFGIEAKVSRDGAVYPITLTNYEKLHMFSPEDFDGCVCDESGILKSYDGATRSAVTVFMRKMKHRLLATATPAPNDFFELGTSSEALGYLGYMDMLNRFFKNDQNNSAMGRLHGQMIKWRLKGHAEIPFWRWVCSWSRAMRKPSDLGFDDADFILPTLTTVEHLVETRTPAPGTLFALPAIGLREQRKERRRTIEERCEQMADLVMEHDCSVVWCHLNDEGDTLERLIPNSIQVAGKHSDEYKEKAALWFEGKLCICNDPMFRGKLAAWTKNSLITKENIIKRIANDGLLRTRNTTNKTKRSETSMHDSTTEITRRFGITTGGNTPTSEMLDDENDMRMTQKNGSGRLTRSSNIDSDTQRQGSSGLSLDTGLLSRSTLFCQQADAPFVDERSERTTLNDCTLTTAMQQDNSGESSANLVILDSESSKTIQRSLSEPQCTCGHISGIRRMITKPSIFGHGLNWQHCAHVGYFPDHSYEQWYQAIRRCWRFGQKWPVTVDVVTTVGEQAILHNLERKAEQADQMFTRLVACMNDSLHIEKGRAFTRQEQVPSWLKKEI